MSTNHGLVPIPWLPGYETYAGYKFNSYTPSIDAATAAAMRREHKLFVAEANANGYVPSRWHTQTLLTANAPSVQPPPWPARKTKLLAKMIGDTGLPRMIAIPSSIRVFRVETNRGKALPMFPEWAVFIAELNAVDVSDRMAFIAKLTNTPKMVPEFYRQRQSVEAVARMAGTKYMVKYMQEVLGVGDP